MLRNYLKIAFRNLLKNRIYSFINLFGLATGMATAMLIGLWIWDEISFDKYFHNYHRLGRIMTTQTFNGEAGTGPATSIPIAGVLRTQYAGDFKKVALTSWNFGHILAVGDKKLSAQGMWVQPDFVEMFTPKMLRGNAKAIADPTSILLSESLAKSLFGNENPVGKILRKDNQTNFTVAGVFEDFPKNTEFNETQLLLPWATYLKTQSWIEKSQDNWTNHSFQMFAQLNDRADFAQTAARIKDIPKAHPETHPAKEATYLHPMSRWHLYSEFKNGQESGGRITFVWLFGIIGAFVLLLACINFMNLSTARSEKRAKEVGVRKAIGSVKSQLVGQFLAESMLVVFIAFFLSVLLVQLSLPWFNQLSDKQMGIQWANPVFWLLVLGFTVFTGLVSGSYPAFYLSGFEPVKVLKGTFRAGRFASIPRKVLVVLQFTVSVTLIIGTMVVFRQIQFAKNRPVGYNREGLIEVNVVTEDLTGHYAALRDDLLKTGAVTEMATSGSPTTNVYNNQDDFSWNGKPPGSSILFAVVAISHEYGKTVGWEVKEGRDFSRSFSTDTSALILNEAAAKIIGFKNPIGETIRQDKKDYKIIGIIKDIIMESPFEPIRPTIFRTDWDWASVVNVRLKPGVPVQEAIAKVETVFRKANPSSPFEYKFIDEQYGKKFRTEARIGTLASVFAGLAILISCLGLFGLASFTAEQRTKEIGVRKVLGATVTDLWLLLSRDFVRLVLISLLISMPLAWYFMHKWLVSYPYHSDLSWWIFVAAITLATVSFQAIKAALANPVKSLRTE
jgi:putative ABC transport system permease protein